MLSFRDLIEPFFYIVDPTKRLFFIYLVSSFVLAVVVLTLEKKKLSGDVLKSILNPKVWFHRSSQLDVYFLFFNSIIKISLFVLVSLSSIEVAKGVARSLQLMGASPLSVSFDKSLLTLVYAVVSFVLLDFTRFFQHYLFHKVPFLWRFHKIHHSAEVLTPVTLYRTHPVESLISSLRRVVVIGVVSGLFIFYSQSMIGAVAVLGVNAFDFVMNFFGSNLRHSHIWLSFGPLNHVFISPAQHQIHHSRADRHRDKNLGFALSIWDKMFGTFLQVRKKEFMIFGVRNENYKSFWQALIAPLKN